MERNIARVLPVAFLAVSLAAGDLAAPTAARIIRVIVQATGGTKVDCADKELAGELANLGLPQDPAAKVAWADSQHEVARLAKEGKLVICGREEWMADGAAVVLTAEGGRPSITLSMKNLGASGVTLPDSVVKIAKVVK
jgi:hypothetical protein